MLDSFTIRILKKKRKTCEGRLFSAITLKALCSFWLMSLIDEFKLTSLVYFYTYSIIKAEMIKCSVTIVDIIAG